MDFALKNKATTQMKTTRIKDGVKWETIGKVDVDSGQLLVCDPCYIESHWKDTPDDSPLATGYWVDKSGNTFALSCHHMKPPFTKCVMVPHCEYPIDELGGKTINQCLDGGELMEINPEPTGEFSYRGCCLATERCGGGQLDHAKDVPGAGVAFTSGYGDGTYPVLARKNRDGRVVEIRIVMDDPSDDDDEN